MSILVWKAIVFVFALKSGCCATAKSSLRVVIERGADRSVLDVITSRIPRDDLQILFTNAPSPCRHALKPTIFFLSTIAVCQAKPSVARLQIAPVDEDFIKLRFESRGNAVVEYEIRRNDEETQNFIISEFIEATTANSNRLLSSANFEGNVKKTPTRVVVRNVLLIGLASMTFLAVVTSIGTAVAYMSGSNLRRKLGLLQAERRALNDRCSAESSTRMSSDKSTRLDGGASDELAESECRIDGNYVGNSIVLRKRMSRDYDAQMPISPFEFKKSMDAMTDYIMDYLDNSGKYPVSTDIEPDSVWTQIPASAPDEPVDFDTVMSNVEKFYVPAMNHWQHPRFHAHFVNGCSLPDILAEVLSSALSVVGFTWDSCPALTELEILIVNWVGRALGLPESFLYTGECTRDSPGGGAIQTGSTDAVLVALLAARLRKIEQKVDASLKDVNKAHALVLHKLVAYASSEAHSSIEKAAKLGMVRLRSIPCDDKFAMRMDALESQIEKDVEGGLIPFFVQPTAGTVSMASFDNLEQIGAIAEKYDMWLHVNGTYGAAAMICPEFRHLFKGIEKADSLDMSAHKLFMHSNCHTFLWTRDQKTLMRAFEVNATYLQGEHAHTINLRDWGITLSRRFLSLKTWILIRLYGITNIQDFVRRTISLAARFREHLSTDHRIALVGEHNLGVVCFQLKAESPEKTNALTARLAEFVNQSRKLRVSRATAGRFEVVRMSFAPERSTEADIEESFSILKALIDEFLKNEP